jgi:hypothetical protein
MSEVNIYIDPVSNAEIADIMGVTRQKVSSLHFHNKLPDPYKVLKCGPLWDKKEITTWLYENNMIKEQEINNAKTTTDNPLKAVE